VGLLNETVDALTEDHLLLLRRELREVLQSERGLSSGSRGRAATTTGGSATALTTSAARALSTSSTGGGSRRSVGGSSSRGSSSRSSGTTLERNQVVGELRVGLLPRTLAGIRTADHLLRVHEALTSARTVVDGGSTSVHGGHSTTNAGATARLRAIGARTATLSMASSELVATHLLGLMESDIERLGAASKDAAVHLSNSALSFLGSGEADEAKAASNGLLILHDLHALDLTKETKLLAKALLVDLILKVLDVEVDTLVLSHAVHLDLLKLLAQLRLALDLLLRATSPHLLLTNDGAIDGLNGLKSILVAVEVDEAEAAAGALLVTHHDSARDSAVLGEELLELSVRDVGIKVLHVDVGPASLLLLLTLLLGAEVANEDLLAAKEHVIYHLDGSLSALSSLEVHETITARLALIVEGDLAAEDVTEGGEGIVELLVTNGEIEVLDKDVANTALADRRITLGPHDTARTTLNGGIVEGVESALSIDDGVEVDVSVAETATSERITANSNRGDWADLVEELEDDAFGHITVELADIEGGRGVRLRRSGGRRRRWGSG